MKKNLFAYQIAFFLVFISAGLYAQNWNIFNKNYRYNYKFNNSAVVTNVLFIDTVKQLGLDTIYTMNRIGVECTSNCPVIPGSNPSATVALWLNMPQFLQRKIKKFSNGVVMLQDTSKIVIIPTCTLNQTWLFDSIANVTATCVITGTQSIFGTTDSVKTILVNADTLKLSKSFGILVYPKLYSQNKYYRLVGIENKSAYDQTALYGEKVPNVWEFFEYSVGDIFTKKSSYYYKNGNTITSYYTFNTFTIQTKSTSSSGYTYTAGYQDRSGSIPGFVYAVDCNDNPPPFGSTYSTGTTQLVYSDLSNPAFNENQMYPGMFIISNSPTTFSYISIGGCGLPENIVKFGVDNTGRFYKYMGKSCPSYSFPVMPNSSAVNAYNKDGNYAAYNPNGFNQYCVGSGVGTVNNNCFFFEGGSHYSLGSAVKNGITYFGQPWIVGVTENPPMNKTLKIYPNPADQSVWVNVKELSNYKIFNVLGGEIMSGKVTSNEPISTSELPAGIYFFQIKNESLTRKIKLIIER